MGVSSDLVAESLRPPADSAAGAVSCADFSADAGAEDVVGVGVVVVVAAGCVWVWLLSLIGDVGESRSLEPDESFVRFFFRKPRDGIEAFGALFTYWIQDVGKGSPGRSNPASRQHTAGCATDCAEGKTQNDQQASYLNAGSRSNPIERQGEE